MSICVTTNEVIASPLPPAGAKQSPSLEIASSQKSLLAMTEADLPYKCGTVEESQKGSSTKTIIYIQDAHDSLEAQKNIAKIIHKLVRDSGVKTVFEEGYEGRVPTDKYFGLIKDPVIRKKVSYFLLDKLRIGGAEYAHINRDRSALYSGPVPARFDFQLLGADNTQLHLENIQWYRRHAKHRRQTQEDLAALQNEIDQLSHQYLPEAIRDWLKLKKRFDAEEIPLLDYLNRAADIVGKAHFEIVKNVDAKILFREMELLEESIAAKFLNSERDRKIFQYQKGLILLQKLNDIAMSQAEFEALKSQIASLRTQEIAAFIVEQTKIPIVLSKRWEENIQNAIHFYATAHQRDESIEKSLAGFFQSPDESIAVLVFGGFHKEGIKQILKKSGVSYHIVVPRIREKDKQHEMFYKQVMSAGHYPFEMPLAIRAGARLESSLQRWDQQPALARAELHAMEQIATGVTDLSMLSRTMEQQLPALLKPAIRQSRDGGSASLAGGRSEARASDPYTILQDLLKAVPPTEKVGGEDDVWKNIGIYDRGDFGTYLISIRLASENSPVNKGQYAIALDNKIVTAVNPDGTITRNEDFDALLAAIQVGIADPEKVKEYVQERLTKEARDIAEIILVHSRWPDGEYEKRQTLLSDLADANAAVNGIDRDKLSLTLFLKVINIFYVSFGEDDEVKSLADIGGRYGSKSIKPLFNDTRSPDAAFLNVGEYQKLHGNHLEFLMDHTLELVNDPKDSQGVRFILRPRHPGQLPREKEYYEFYRKMVQEGIPVTYDDPDGGFKQNQFSKIFLGDYNAKYDERNTRNKYPLFPDSSRSEARTTVTNQWEEWQSQLQNNFGNVDALNKFKEFLKTLPFTDEADFTDFLIYFLFTVYPRGWNHAAPNAWPSSFPKRGHVIKAYQALKPGAHAQLQKLLETLPKSEDIPLAGQAIPDAKMFVEQDLQRIENLMPQLPELFEEIRQNGFVPIYQQILGEYQRLQGLPKISGRFDKEWNTLKTTAEHMAMLLTALSRLQAGKLKMQTNQVLSDGSGHYFYYPFRWRHQGYRLLVLSRWQGSTQAMPRFGFFLLHPTHGSNETHPDEKISFHLEWQEHRHRAVFNFSGGKYLASIPHLKNADAFAHFVKSLDEKIAELSRSEVRTGIDATWETFEEKIADYLHVPDRKPIVINIQDLQSLTVESQGKIIRIQGLEHSRDLSVKSKSTIAPALLTLANHLADQIYQAQPEKIFFKFPRLIIWPTYAPITDPLGYILYEMLKNAVAHGNKIDLPRPIYISWYFEEMPEPALKISIFDTANPDLSKWETGLSGKRIGRRGIHRLVGTENYSYRWWHRWRWDPFKWQPPAIKDDKGKIIGRVDEVRIPLETTRRSEVLSAENEIQTIARQRREAAGPALQFLNQVPAAKGVKINIYVMHQALNGVFGGAYLLAKALRHQIKNATVNLLLVNGQLPGPFQRSLMPGIALYENFKPELDTAQRTIKKGEFHILVLGKNVPAQLPHVGDLRPFVVTGGYFSRDTMMPGQGMSDLHMNFRDPHSSVPLDIQRQEAAAAKDRMSFEQLAETKEVWHQKLAVSRALHDFASSRKWEIGKSILSWGYVQDKEYLRKELQKMMEAVTSGALDAQNLWTPKGRQILIHLFVGKVAGTQGQEETQTILKQMDASYIDLEGNLHEGNQPVTVIFHNDILHADLQQLQVLSGTMMPYEDKEKQKHWIGFPAFVTGMASSLEVMSSGQPWIHDRNDAGKNGFKDAHELLVGNVLKLQGAAVPPLATLSNMSAQDLSQEFLMNSDRKIARYEDLTGWSQLARWYSDSLYQMNMIDDLIIALAKRKGFQETKKILQLPSQPVGRQQPKSSSAFFLGGIILAAASITTWYFKEEIKEKLKTIFLLREGHPVNFHKDVKNEILFSVDSGRTILSGEDYTQNKRPRSEMRAFSIDRLMMRKVRNFSPRQLVKKVKAMAVRPEIKDYQASFFIDVINRRNAQAYIGYGIHGLFDKAGSETRRFFFRVHYRDLADQKGLLGFKPPYLLEQQLAEFQKRGKEMKMFEAILIDLKNIAEFLVRGGMDPKTPVNLQEFSDFAVLTDLFGKRYRHNGDLDSYETALGELIQTLPSLAGEVVNSSTKPRSEARALMLQNDRTVKELKKALQKNRKRFSMAQKQMEKVEYQAKQRDSLSFKIKWWLHILSYVVVMVLAVHEYLVLFRGVAPFIMANQPVMRVVIGIGLGVWHLYRRHKIELNQQIDRKFINLKAERRQIRADLLKHFKTSAIFVERELIQTGLRHASLLSENIKEMAEKLDEGLVDLVFYGGQYDEETRSKLKKSSWEVYDAFEDFLLEIIALREMQDEFKRQAAAEKIKEAYIPSIESSVKHFLDLLNGAQPIPRSEVRSWSLSGFFDPYFSNHTFGDPHADHRQIADTFFGRNLLQKLDLPLRHAYRDQLFAALREVHMRGLQFIQKVGGAMSVPKFSRFLIRFKIWNSRFFDFFHSLKVFFVSLFFVPVHIPGRSDTNPSFAKIAHDNQQIPSTKSPTVQQIITVSSTQNQKSLAAGFMNFLWQYVVAANMLSVMFIPFKIQDLQTLLPPQEYVYIHSMSMAFFAIGGILSFILNKNNININNNKSKKGGSERFWPADSLGGVIPSFSRSEAWRDAKFEGWVDDVRGILIATKNAEPVEEVILMLNNIAQHFSDQGPWEDVWTVAQLPGAYDSDKGTRVTGRGIRLPFDTKMVLEALALYLLQKSIDHPASAEQPFGFRDAYSLEDLSKVKGFHFYRSEVREEPEELPRYIKKLIHISENGTLAGGSFSALILSISQNWSWPWRVGLAVVLGMMFGFVFRGYVQWKKFLDKEDALDKIQMKKISDGQNRIYFLVDKEDHFLQDLQRGPLTQMISRILRPLDIFSSQITKIEIGDAENKNFETLFEKEPWEDTQAFDDPRVLAMSKHEEHWPAIGTHIVVTYNKYRSEVRRGDLKSVFKSRLGKVAIGTAAAGALIFGLYFSGNLEAYFIVKGAAPPGSILYWPAAIFDMLTGILVWGTSDFVGQYLNRGSRGIEKKQTLIVASGGIFQGLATHVLLNLPQYLPVLPWILAQQLFRTFFVLSGGMFISLVFARLTSLARRLLKTHVYEEHKEIKKTLDMLATKLLFAPPKTFMVINFLPPPVRVITEQLWDYLMTIWSSYLMNRENPLFVKHLPTRLERFLNLTSKLLIDIAPDEFTLPSAETIKAWFKPWMDAHGIADFHVIIKPVGGFYRITLARQPNDTIGIGNTLFRIATGLRPDHTKVKVLQLHHRYVATPYQRKGFMRLMTLFLLQAYPDTEMFYELHERTDDTQFTGSVKKLEKDGFFSGTLVRVDDRTLLGVGHQAFLNRDTIQKQAETWLKSSRHTEGGQARSGERRSELRASHSHDGSLGRQRAVALVKFLKSRTNFKNRPFTVTELADSDLMQQPSFAMIDRDKKTTLRMALQAALLEANRYIELLPSSKNPQYYQLREGFRSEARVGKKSRPAEAIVHEPGLRGTALVRARREPHKPKDWKTPLYSLPKIKTEYENFLKHIAHTSNPYRLSASILALSRADRKAFEAWRRPKEPNIPSVFRFPNYEDFVGGVIGQFSGAVYMPALELLDKIQGVSWMDRFGDSLGQIDEVLRILAPHHLKAHGMSSNTHTGGFVLSDQWAMLNIMIEGSLGKGYYGVLDTDRQDLYRPGAYGPFYLIFKKNDLNRLSEIGRQGHAIYLVPTPKAAVFINEGLQKAMKLGLITKADALEAKERVMTFGDVIQYQDKLSKIVTGEITPAQAMKSVTPRSEVRSNHVSFLRSLKQVKDFPVYEFFKALNFEKISELQKVKTYRSGTYILRARIEAKSTPGSVPQGLEILSAELAPVERFDFLFNAKRQLIAVFPVMPAASKNQTAYYFDLSPYYVSYRALRLEGKDPEAQWKELTVGMEKNSRIITRYVKQEKITSKNHLQLKWDFSKTPFVFIDIDSKTGNMTMAPFYPGMFDQSLPKVHEQESRLRPIFKKNPGHEQIILTILPTVYSPGFFNTYAGWNTADLQPNDPLPATIFDAFSHFVFSNRQGLQTSVPNAYLLEPRDELGISSSIYNQLQQVKFRKGDAILDDATGTGFWLWLDWIAAGKNKSLKWHAIDINPIAVANARITAKTAMIPAIFRQHDTILSLQGDFVFGDTKFKVVTSNPPAYSADTVAESLAGYHDNTSTYFERFLEGLKRRLLFNGLALVWHQGASRFSASEEDEIFRLIQEKGFSVSIGYEHFFRRRRSDWIYAIRHQFQAAHSPIAQRSEVRPLLKRQRTAADESMAAGEINDAGVYDRDENSSAVIASPLPQAGAKQSPIRRSPRPAFSGARDDEKNYLRNDVRIKAIEKMTVPAGVFMDARELVQLSVQEVDEQLDELLKLLRMHQSFDIYVDGTDRYPIDKLPIPKLQQLLNKYSKRIHLGMHDRARLNQKQILLQVSFLKDKGSAADTEKAINELKERYQLQKEILPLEYLRAGVLKGFLDLVESLTPEKLREQVSRALAAVGDNGRWQVVSENFISAVSRRLRASYVVQWAA